MTLSNEYRSYTNTSADEESRLVELINDALLIAPSITTALLHSKSPTKSTFVYNYAALEPMELAGGDYLKHSAAKSTAKSKEITNSTTIFEELSMVFGQPLVPSMRLIQRAAKRNYSNLEVKLSEKLIHYWTRFAMTGDPNAQTTSPYHHSAYHHSGSPASAKDALSNHPTSSNYSQNDVISAQQPKAATPAGRTEHWPTFNEHTQLHLNLNLHPTVSDHMRSHPLSFFLNLLPKLNRPVANNMQMNEHHLLEDHHNLATYEGVVREHPAAGLMRNIALDLEDQLASKRMLELLLNGERQLSEQSNDEKTKLGSLMKLREKLLKWKFISEQSNMETQQNYDDLIRKLTSRIEGGSGGSLARGNSTIVIEMDSNQENGQESAGTNGNQHPNQLGQETAQDQSGNQDDEQEENSIQQNLKQINSPPNTQHPKLSNEQLNYQMHHNANESFSMIIQDGNYGTALSVAIIVGCTLLFLNLLVFAGVFLNRDSRRRRNGNGSHDQQTSNGNALGGNNEHHLLNNALLANGGQLTGTTASLNGQQLKAYQANSSFYLPCCEYDTGGHQQQQQCNATILTLKRNSSNKTYIAKTSTCGQLKQHSIEGDYYLQQQQQNYLDNCLDGCLDDHRNGQHNHGSTINSKISANNELSATFDLANELDKQNVGATDNMANGRLQQQQQQIDCLTIDGSSGLGSSLDNTLSQTLSNSVNSGNTITNLINGGLMGPNGLNQLNGKLTMGDHLLQQHHQQLGVDLVNVSCSSAISSSSAATMITSSPANTLTSTPDYYTNGLHHAAMLGNNQSLGQSNGALVNSNYLSQTRNFQTASDQIQGLYGHHQGNPYSVQLSGLSPGDTMTVDSLDAQQQSKLMNSNHCNIINCSISQCDCDPATNGLFKEDYHHRVNMQSNS